MGRLLISLVLGTEGVLAQPFFYFSLYLRENRGDYYDALQRVRTLFDEDRQRVAALGRAAGSALRVYDLLRDRIVVSAPKAAGELGLTWPTVNSALRRLEHLDIVREASGRQRGRLYVYQRQLDLLNG